MHWTLLDDGKEYRSPEVLGDGISESQVASYQVTGKALIEQATFASTNLRM
jgi:hypothetical protein